MKTSIIYFFKTIFSKDIDIPLLSYKEISKWLWSIFKEYKTQSILNIIIGIILVLTDLCFVWTTKEAIDIATSKHTISLIPSISMFLFLFFFQVLLGEALRWNRAILGVKSQNKMQYDIFNKLLYSKWYDLKQFHTGDLLNRLEIDVNTVIKFITENIPTLIRTLFQLIGAFLLLFWMNPLLAFAIVFLIPLFVLCSKLIFSKMRKISRLLRDTDSQIQSVLQECLQHVMIIKTLQRIPYTLSKLTQKQDLLRKQIYTKTKYSTFSFGVLNLGFGIGYMVAFTWGAVSLHRGIITYGALLAFIQLVGQIQSPIRQLTNFLPLFINAFTSSERIITLLNIPREAEDKDILLKDYAGIRVKNISFSYTKASKSVFKDFSYNFPIGSRTAILGTTGTGKTTLIRLFLSLIYPQKGEILLYTKEQELEVAPNLRCNYSYVPQGNTLLSGTIRTNLLMGNPKATQEEMYLALEHSCADFVYNLPDKLDTLCGELGAGLSEGQAQRIAIARALLHSAPILLLDEATSALDEQTEEKVLYNIMKVYEQKTIIVVTHRPKVLEMCNNRIYLENC